VLAQKLQKDFIEFLLQIIVRWIACHNYRA
jgi:hypothetical protein